MAEKDGSPSVVTARELAAVLQAMDEKYKALFDAISKQGESSRPESEVKEDVHPLQLPHVKLEGSENYSSWAEHAETILVSRNLEGYILGTMRSPQRRTPRKARSGR